MKKKLALAFALVVSTGVATFADDPLVVTATRTTAPLYSYEDAPATPDADDPAIWINRRNARQSLVIGTAKDAGLLVYDLNGTLVQALLPPNAPQVLPADPPTPRGPNPAPDNPCVDSDEGETFGRYNNVDIAYNIRLGSHRRAPRVDVAVVSDRGCDRVRVFQDRSLESERPARGHHVTRRAARVSHSLRSALTPAVGRGRRPRVGAIIRSTIRTRSTG